MTAQQTMAEKLRALAERLESETTLLVLDDVGTGALFSLELWW
jgi:EAL domain-containing protein (putative c-di-GMP-specific phosphodiesterase class I)